MKKFSVLVACLILSASFVGCKAKPKTWDQLELPPEPSKVYSAPDWYSTNGFIKAVGMLPSSQPYAQAFWTKDNRLFVMGSDIELSDWERYYRIKTRKAHPMSSNSNFSNIERLISILPVWDARTGEVKAVVGHQKYMNVRMGGDYDNIQLNDGRVMYIGRAYGHKSGERELYDPVKGTSEILAVLSPYYGKQGAIHNFDGKLLTVSWHKYWADGPFKENLTSKYGLQDPLTGEYTPLIDIYPGHEGSLAIMPDKQHLIIAGGECISKSQEAEMAKAKDAEERTRLLMKCALIKYVDLKKKTFRDVPLPYSESVNSDYGYRAGKLIAIDNNRVLLVGGRFDGKIDKLNQVGLFNVKTDKFNLVGELTYPWGNQKNADPVEHVLRMSDGSIVILGNYLYVFDQKSEKLTQADHLIIDQSNYGAVVTPDDKVYIAGGAGGREPRLIQMFDYQEYKKQINTKRQVINTEEIRE